MQTNKYGGINDMPNCNERVYRLWYQMLRRCYDKEQQQRKRGKSYADCYVCDRWMTLSNFAEDIRWLSGYKLWIKSNEYCLDKDTIIHGNKEYSPTRCKFITKKENTREANLRTKSYRAANEANKVVYVLEKENEVLVFDSEATACDYLGVRRCSVSSCRRRNSRCKGYKVSCAKMEEDGE